MTFIFSILLGISIGINIILVWYTRKLIKNLYYGINNVDELQKLLNEYVVLLEPILNMENYYGDPIITSTIANTKMVVEACGVYKNSILENYDEENQKEQKEDIKKEDQAENTTTKN